MEALGALPAYYDELTLKPKGVTYMNEAFIPIILFIRAPSCTPMLCIAYD